MEDYKAGEKGRLNIGISPFRATYFLSNILIKLRNEYKDL